MINRILDLLKLFYKKHGTEAKYILISEEIKTLLDNEVNKHFVLFSINGSRPSPEITSFHGMTIIVIKGKYRLELA